MKVCDLIDAIPNGVTIEIKTYDPKIGIAVLDWYGKAENLPISYNPEEIAFIAPFVDNRIKRKGDDPQSVTSLKILLRRKDND